MSASKQAAEIVGLVNDWRDLDALPVGSVVMARDKRHLDVWPWVKTDDTDLLDEYGERVTRAWACVAYTDDRESPALLIESSAVRIVWRGDTNIETVTSPTASSASTLEESS